MSFWQYDPKDYAVRTRRVELPAGYDVSGTDTQLPDDPVEAMEALKKQYKALDEAYTGRAGSTGEPQAAPFLVNNIGWELVLPALLATGVVSLTGSQPANMALIGVSALAGWKLWSEADYYGQVRGKLNGFERLAWWTTKRTPLWGVPLGLALLAGGVGLGYFGLRSTVPGVMIVGGTVVLVSHITADAEELARDVQSFSIFGFHPFKS